eukprot:scaffold22865_cov92-Isochrysis_galbana.AAC.4
MAAAPPSVRPCPCVLLRRTTSSWHGHESGEVAATLDPRSTNRDRDGRVGGGGRPLRPRRRVLEAIDMDNCDEAAKVDTANRPST